MILSDKDSAGPGSALILSLCGAEARGPGVGQASWRLERRTGISACKGRSRKSLQLAMSVAARGPIKNPEPPASKKLEIESRYVSSSGAYDGQSRW
jgi:hypothetical protein